MAIIHAVDNEFAVATGNNVDATSRFSYFDETDSFEDLTITSHSDDDDPYLFEVGETYTLTFGGQDGGGILEDATVIRSDPLGSGQGVVVFEGTDPEHGPMQIVWSPGFDLDGWIANNEAAGKTAAFYTYDTQPDTYGYVCFTAGTLITTPHGPRAAESLHPGDQVLTRDGGARPIIWAGRRRVLGSGASAPVRFEPGFLGNDTPLLVSQQHRMLLTGPEAELMFGSYEVLAPAKALVGLPGASLAPCREVDYVHLLLDSHEILFANGAASESLFLGDLATRTLADGGSPDAALFRDALATILEQRRTHMTPARPLLTVREGKILADTLRRSPPFQASDCEHPRALTA